MLMYSGPPIVKVAMMTALRKDWNWDEESVPTQGVSFQLRNPNLLRCQLRPCSNLGDLLSHGVSTAHGDQSIEHETDG